MGTDLKIETRNLAIQRPRPKRFRRGWPSGVTGEIDSACCIDFYFGDSKNWAVSERS